jgi:glutathione S-transferase
MARLLEAGRQTSTFHAAAFKAGKLVIAQTANILGPRLGLAAKDEGGRLWTHQLQLTLADWAAEVHDTHHPVASSMYYEDQKGEAKRRPELFRGERLPKFLHYFDQVLERKWKPRARRQDGFLRRSVAVPDDRGPAPRVSTRDYSKSKS